MTNNTFNKIFIYYIMDPLDTTNEFIMVEVDKPPFGKRKIRQPNPYYIAPSTPESYSSPTINVNNSRLDAFKALEEKQKFKNNEMIKNLKADSSGFGNHGGKKSRKSKRSRRSRKGKRSRRSRRSRRY